jgi:DNA segregation ATPase FtsK/SpoIIIE-like protein
MVIDGSNAGKFMSFSPLEPLSNLPHMLTPVAYTSDEYRGTLDFLCGECLYREEQQMISPKIVVMIDEVVNLLSPGREGQQIAENIVLLLQRGPAVGIHLVLTTSDPQAEQLNNTFRLSLPARLVGRVNDSTQAIAAANMPGIQAEYLLGQGDFLAVMDGVTTHFQAAYVGEYDLQLALDALQRQRPQPLLAQPVPVNRLSINPEKSFIDQTQMFTTTTTGIEFSS